MTNREIPLHAVILHTPWVLKDDSSRDYFGLITDSDLPQCCQESELLFTTPVLSDCFLSLTDSPMTFSDTIEDDVTKHVHILKHDHRKTVWMNATTTARIDKNNYFSATDESAPGHTHQVHLETSQTKLIAGSYLSGPSSEPTDPVWEYHEPLHQEVNAYYVLAPKEIPVGMLVFYELDEGKQIPDGWQCLNEDALKKSPKDPDVKYYPKPWKDLFLKIVGCLPAKSIKGNRHHSHSGASHTHYSGSIGTGNGGTEVDDSDPGIARVARPDHTHEIDKINRCPEDSTSNAENEPTNFGIAVLVAVKKDAVFVNEMLLPYIPKDYDAEVKIGNLGPCLVNSGVWLVEMKGISSSVFYRSVKELNNCGDFRDMQLHTHEFLHSHWVKAKDASKTKQRTSKAEIECSGDDHRHEFKITDKVETGPAPNPLRHRRVLFLRYYDNTL